ncbi:MAG: cation diffusion facilitator family transporter [Planctomycetota bacterium]|jgi:cation diffusion facilitator family transporter
MTHDDHEPPRAEPISDLYRRARAAAIIGLLINAALAIVKLVAGIVGNSIALIADAVNSIGDALTSGVLLYALGVAQRPPDVDHPYGHSRAEAVAALGVAIVIGVTALGVAVESIRSIASAHAVPPVWTLWIAAGNAVVKEGMYRYKLSVARRTGSQALVAGAWDHRSDAMCSLAVLVGLAVVRYGGESVIWADEVAALVVVGFIVFMSVRLSLRNASQLMDAQSDDETIGAIRRIAEGTAGVVGVEQVRARRSGIETFVDIHVEVDGALSVTEGHRIGHDVKRRLLDGITSVTEVLVHVEPAE